MAMTGQKAPSAKRCIKTRHVVPGGPDTRVVRKHRAPKGALRLSGGGGRGDTVPDQSESTERQKVH